jgi:hypothetical protein
MRTLLALGSGHWPERRASDHLPALREGSVAIQGAVVIRPKRSGSSARCAGPIVFLFFELVFNLSKAMQQTKHLPNDILLLDLLGGGFLVQFDVVRHALQRLLNCIIPDFVHVMADGCIIKSGDKNMALELESRVTKRLSRVEPSLQRHRRCRLDGNAGFVFRFIPPPGSSRSRSRVGRKADRRKEW